MFYEIRHLPNPHQRSSHERWLRWVEGLDVSPLPEGETVISGEMDQSALHGVLNRIRDLSLELISVYRQ
jgi:hypothetical protein